MNIVDKIIEYTNPRLAYKREAFRKAIDVVRKYDGAARTKRTSSWQATDASANTENAPALNILRARSRDLVRNNNYAKKANFVIPNNVIGTGIRPSPNSDNKEVDAKIKKYWKEWAEKTKIDYYGRMNFYGIQELVMKTVAQSGECFVRKIITTGKETIPLKLQILEPDYLDTAKDGMVWQENEIKQGIEINAKDQRVAYWMFKQHPGETGVKFELNSIRIPAEEILHIYIQDRPGQLRGVPMGVSAMIRTKDLDDYEDAQLVRQKIAACFTAFVSGSTDGVDGAMAGESNGTDPTRLEPGRVEYLNPGETVTLSSPPAAENYESYTKTVLRGIAAGYGITYEALTNDLSNVNFSSGRMGWIEFQKQLDSWQQYMVIPQLCEPIWDEFMKFLKLRGLTKDAIDATWTPPRREMIDPGKEVAAIKESIRAGLSSLPDVIQQMGGDPDNVIEEIRKFNELLDAKGIILDSDPRKDVKRITKEPIKTE